MATTAADPNDPFAAMGGGVKLANGAWVPNNHPLAQTAAASPAPAPGGPSPAPAGPITTNQQVATGSAPVGGSAAQGQPTTVAASFQQALVNRLNPAPVDANNPQIAPAIAANQYAEQRGVEAQQNALAERAAAEGTNNSGGFDSRLLGLKEDSAGRQATFAGNLVNELGQQENADKTSAMAGAGSLLSGEQGFGQQMTLADLDAELRRQAEADQTSLGTQDLALRSKQGDMQGNIGLLSLLLNDQQFGQQLGQQGAQFGAGLDNQTLLALLGGL